MNDESSRGTITALLARGGGRATFDELVPLVYGQLCLIARRQLAGAWRQQTLDTSALVHELYLRLVDERRCRSVVGRTSSRRRRTPRERCWWTPQASIFRRHGSSWTLRHVLTRPSLATDFGVQVTMGAAGFLASSGSYVEDASGFNRAVFYYPFGIFVDGFESGDTSRWSGSPP
jgi:hypothetical protein